MADTTSIPTVSSTSATTGVGIPVGSESSLSNWVGPYVTEMLGRGEALSNMPYQAYMGPLTAGESNLQSTAFEGLGNLNVPATMSYTPQSFTDTGVAQQYMNPYIQSALDPQIAEARRQAAIQAQQTAGQYTKAGAYGGGRQALAGMEGNRNLLQNLASITATGYQNAYDKATQQFNAEQQLKQQAANLSNQYGLAALGKQAELGATQRDITQQGIAADLAQFQEQRDYPYKQVQYMQSLLSGLPLATQNYNYTQPTSTQQALSGAGGLYNLYNTIFGGSSGTSGGTSTSSGTTSTKTA